MSLEEFGLLNISFFTSNKTLSIKQFVTPVSISCLLWFNKLCLIDWNRNLDSAYNYDDSRLFSVVIKNLHFGADKLTPTSFITDTLYEYVV